MAPQPSVQLRLFGDRKVRDAIKKLAAQYPKGIGAALYRVGVSILSAALPLTPVEFGVLRGSGYVSPPTGSKEKTQVEVGFGTVYAVPQHESMGLRHPRGGGPKYLERGAQAVAPTALESMAKWLKANPGASYSQNGGTPTHPTIPPSAEVKRPQVRRFARAGRNVRKRTGR